MKDTLSSCVPKRLRRAVIGVHARLRSPRLRARWPVVLLAVLLLSVFLLRAAFRSPAGASAFAHAKRARAAPLDATAFAAIVSHLSNATNVTARPRLSDPALIRAGAARWARTRRADTPPSAWDAIASDVAIAVKTGHEVAEARLRVLREHGWLSLGRAVPNLLVVSDVDDEKAGVVGVKRYAIDVVAGALAVNATKIHPRRWFDRDGWRGDKDKNLPILHMLASTFPGKKWYILLDDDTHIFLDNFARYASKSQLSSQPVYTGKVFYISNCGGFSRTGSPKGDPHGEKGLFAHGGAGIFINSLAMRAMFPRIAGCIAQFSSCWAGDMQVGLCMHQAGIRVRNFIQGRSHEYMFTPFWPSRAMADSRYTKRLRSLLEPVTFHKIPFKELQLITQFEHHCAVKGVPVVYNGLREYLQDHGIEPVFGRKNTRYDTRIFFRKR